MPMVHLFADRPLEPLMQHTDWDLIHVGKIHHSGHENDDVNDDDDDDDDDDLAVRCIWKILC